MITPSKQANRKKTEEKISQPSIKTIPSATTYMQQIKILFSTDELSIKFKPLNCYGTSRLRGLRGICPLTSTERYTKCESITYIRAVCSPYKIFNYFLEL